MERHILSVAMCLAVLMTWTAAIAEGKTADEIAVDHACTYFRATDPNKDLIATILDYIFEWLTVPICGSKPNLIIDVKRQVDILQQYIYVFPLTETNILKSLLSGGVKLEEFIETIRRKLNSATLEGEVGDLVRFVMKVFNYDGDEQSFTKNELQILWNVVRLDNATTTFAHLDEDRDGFVSYDEYFRVGVCFFRGVENGSCEWFVGPPKTCDEVRAEKCKWIDPIASGSTSLPLPVGGSIGNVTVLANLLNKDPILKAKIDKIFSDYFGEVPAALSSLLGIASSLLGALGSVPGLPAPGK